MEQVLMRGGESQLGEEYNALYKELSTLPSDSPKEKILEIADRMKVILLTAVEGTSRTNSTYDQDAKNLIRVLFNRFKLNEFDNLFDEMKDKQLEPMAPFGFEPQRDDKVE